MTAVCGPAPPPSGTCAVSHGGVAILSRLPLTLRIVRPAELLPWITKGRILPAYVLAPSTYFLLIVIYGYPVGHKDRPANDQMLHDVLTWSASVKAAVLITGDSE